MTHTPGPWIVTPELGCKDIGPADREDDDGIYAIAGTYGISPEADDRENATLIAAAPELLAVCLDSFGGLNSPAQTLEQISETFDEYSGWGRWLRLKAAQMRAAIAKAEGGAQ